MTAAGHSTRDQARLWLVAFGVSAVLNGLILFALGLTAIANLVFMPPPRQDPGAEGKPQEEEMVALIVPETIEVLPAPAAPAKEEEPPPPPERFARTSRDQEAPAPERPAFIGERNTRATSDLAPDAAAPALPSQQGEEPDNEGDMETTVSRYQDGDLATDRIARPDAAQAPSELPPGPDAPEPMRQESAAAAPPVPPPAPAAPQEVLAEGTLPVERQVKAPRPGEKPSPEEPPLQADAEANEKPAETPEELPKEAPGKQEMAAKEQPGKDSPPTRPAPSVRQADPGFRGYQYKHRIHGSISRQGRSALDVEDSVLGRYHAQLSRAVEREWQRNCIRNRDYITPGQIIVRFVLESNGKVRSVNFIEEFGVGNIQKGFTSESIRSADIPPFSAEMKKQLDGEPLEVTYSFTF